MEILMLLAGAALALAIAGFWLRRERTLQEAHYRDLLATMKNEFRALSDDVLKEKRAEFEREGLSGVARFTGSLMHEVQAFRKRVDEVNSEDVARTAELEANIRNLLGQTSQVSEQANRLATAIRSDAQVTGLWGEIQLRRVLELGGLEETVDYTYQEPFASVGSDYRDLRTDVLVKMPDNRWLVIDAKTTMAAYVDYIGDNGERNEAALARIRDSIVAHIREMKTADYHRKLAKATGRQILNTMFMYIPFEEVYLFAMKSEIDVGGGKIPLREWAWQNEVVLVNASSLVPIVRMLAQLWARDRAEKKVLKIKDAAESLIEKFSLFLQGGSKKDGFLAVGQNLAAAVTAYNESVKRLSTGPGSVLKKLSGLREMGVTRVDKLPQPEQVEAGQVKIAPLEAPEVKA